MPKQNRPLVRDGRIQAKKKRTDRSYLRSNGARTPVADEVTPETNSAADLAPTSEESAAAASMVTAAASTGSTSAPVRSTSGRLPTTVRAIQQQGVRKRREFDVHALAIRDTQYAFHEIRRIFFLASAVIITLIVLGFVLR